MTFRAGDTVKHHPSGETWILACDQEQDYVLPRGSTEQMVKASDCELVTAASYDERREMLQRVMSSTSHGLRVQLATRQWTGLQLAETKGRA